MRGSEQSERSLKQAKSFQAIYRDVVPPGVGYWDKEAGRINTATLALV